MTRPPLLLLGIEFRHAGEVLVERDRDGAVVEFMPQSRYGNVSGSALNPNGEGPFCRLRVPGLPPAAGVYAVLAGDEVMYVGIAANLRQRWSVAGYGSIQPKNCFVGGQSTNCKVNGNVLRLTKAGRSLDLYVVESPDRATIERRLIRELAPPWNGRQR